MERLFTYFGKELANPAVSVQNKAVIVTVLYGVIGGELTFTWDKNNEPKFSKVDMPTSYEVN